MKRLLVSCTLIFALMISPVYALESNYQNSLLDELVNLSVEVNALLGADMTKNEILMIRENLISQAEYQATIQSKSTEEVYELYIKELQQQISSENASPMASTQKSPLPSAQSGYIFFTDTNTFYNHCGIYKDSTSIVEALTVTGVWSKSIYDRDSYQTTVISDNDSAVLSVPTATSAIYSNAASWAYSKVGRPYDIDFLDNKLDGTYTKDQWIDEDVSYNCSELVWKAFMKSSNRTIDLDSNGGMGVYPNDIYESSLTKTYKTFG